MIYLISNSPGLFYSEDIKVERDYSKLFDYYQERLSQETYYVGVDSETRGFDPHTKPMTLLQIGDSNVQFVIDVTTISLEPLKDFFKDERLRFIFHNALFDLKFLYKNGIVPTNVEDTFIAETVLNVGRLTPPGYKSLAGVCKRYLKVILDKEPRGLLHKMPHTNEVIIRYAANDVVHLENVLMYQKEKLEERDLYNYYDLESKFSKALAYIMYSGIGFDRGLWLELAKEDEELLDKSENALNSFILNNPHEFGKWIDNQLDLFSSDLKTNINWSSDKQVLEVMEYLGLDCNYIEKGEQKKGVGVKVMTPQKDKHPIVPLFLEYQKHSKAVSTFGKSYLKFINPKTGRIHTNYTQIKNTTRMSCGGSNKSTGEEYPNLQQIPNGPKRDAFVAEEGNIMISADYSGQEDIIFANKCLDPNLLDFYDKKLGDGHSFVAKLCFPNELADIPLEDVKKKRPDLRQKAKSANFAIKFGGVGFTISNNLSIPAEEGEFIYNSYMKGFPGIKSYFDKVFKEAEGQGYVLISRVSGAKSYFDFYEEYLELKKQVNNSTFWEKYRYEKAANSDYFNRELKSIVKKYFQYEGTIRRRSYNYPIQGEGANITKLAAIKIFNRIIEEDKFDVVKIVHTVHDEILVECPENEGKKWAEIVKESMESAGLKFFNRIPLQATPEIGKKWIH